MPEGTGQITCEEFQRHLSQLLGSDDPIEEHPHYRKCMICRALVRNFEKMIENTLGECLGTDDWPEST
jgi:hypothetical protein